MFKRVVKQAIAAAKVPFLKFRRLGNDGLVILMFHKVSDHDDGLGITISPALFEAALTEIGNHCDFVRLDRYFSNTEGSLHRLKFAVTFDDGYLDNYTTAWPILKKLKIPATIFLTTGAIDRTTTLWFERVDAICRNFVGQAVSLPEFGVEQCAVRNAADRLDLQRVLHQALKEMDSRSRDRKICELEARYPPDREGMSEMMSWHQVGEMATDDIEFGAHTVTHPILSREDSSTARDEIASSKTMIERKLDHPVVGFAYPNGTRSDYTKENVGEVADAGFEYACTTLAGINSRPNPSLELKRISVFNDGINTASGGMAAGRLWASCLASV